MNFDQMTRLEALLVGARTIRIRLKIGVVSHADTRVNATCVHSLYSVGS